MQCAALVHLLLLMQIEGAYNEWGKGQSIWDVFVRESGKIKGGGTGDVAIDHAHRYTAVVTRATGLEFRKHSVLLTCMACVYGVVAKQL